MGEWSDYFEDFPEENPANWVNGRFDPQAAELARKAEEKNKTQLNYSQAKLDEEIRQIIKKHQRK